MTHRVHLTNYDGEPFDWDLLVKEKEARMAKVVLISDLARHYDRDPGSFLKLLKRNDIELLFVTDPTSGQQRRCVTKEVARDVRELMEPEHEVIAVEEALN